MRALPPWPADGPDARPPGYEALCAGGGELANDRLDMDWRAASDAGWVKKRMEEGSREEQKEQTEWKRQQGDKARERAGEEYVWDGQDSDASEDAYREGKDERNWQAKRAKREGKR